MKKHRIVVCILACVILFTTACQNRKIAVDWDEWMYDDDVVLLNGFPYSYPTIVGSQLYAQKSVLSWLREENFVQSNVSTSDIRGYDKLYSFMHFYPMISEKEFRERDRLELYTTAEKLFARIEGSDIIYESVNPYVLDYHAFTVGFFGDGAAFLPLLNIPKDIGGDNFRVYTNGDLLSSEDASKVAQEIRSNQWDMVTAVDSKGADERDAVYQSIAKRETAYILCGLQKNDGIVFYVHYMDDYLMLKYNDTNYFYKKK